MSPTYKHAPTVCEEGGIWGKIKNLEVIIRSPWAMGYSWSKGFTLMISHLHNHPLGNFCPLLAAYSPQWNSSLPSVIKLEYDTHG